MSLKITLKPNERMIIGTAVVKNGNSTVNLYVENNVPLLREKDILGEADATTVCKRIYFAIQLMYVDSDNISVYQKAYEELTSAVLAAAPSTKDLVEQINESIAAAKYYPALKLARQLVEYEERVITTAADPS